MAALEWTHDHKDTKGLFQNHWWHGWNASVPPTAASLALGLWPGPRCSLPGEIGKQLWDTAVGHKVMIQVHLMLQRTSPNETVCQNPPELCGSRRQSKGRLSLRLHSQSWGPETAHLLTLCPLPGSCPHHRQKQTPQRRKVRLLEALETTARPRGERQRAPVAVRHGSTKLHCGRKPPSRLACGHGPRKRLARGMRAAAQRRRKSQGAPQRKGPTPAPRAPNRASVPASRADTEPGSSWPATWVSVASSEVSHPHRGCRE